MGPFSRLTPSLSLHSFLGGSGGDILSGRCLCPEQMMEMFNVIPLSPLWSRNDICCSLYFEMITFITNFSCLFQFKVMIGEGISV